eukprot:CAMPEP_0185251372 /NCGR_PEP_ID=MMETSP1359-20130426/780_1 /TAXON_ID=552665 /ORGANISM="Bigelowiella longifila, Strain CCMP242" /LENGTH=184 /DNA_ID=CAMNT_0027833235 /DNA_START=336 /DNA_END=890 /DNA_ORIENTATION=-
MAVFSVLAATLLLVVFTRSRSNLEQPLKPLSSRATMMSRNSVRSMRAPPAFLQAARSASTIQSRSTRCFAAGEISEVDKDSYHAAIKDAGDKLVLVDFYTDWCGPCKMIYPFLQELARDNADSLEIIKMNCAGDNRELVNELGVRVLPTFFFYKNEKNIAIVKGAKKEDLQNLIAEHTAVSSSP